MTIVIVVKEQTSDDEMAEIIDLARLGGGEPQVLTPTLLTVPGADPAVTDLLGRAPQVRHVTAITADYPRASAGSRGGELSTVRFGGASIGPGVLTVIAGPCSVESRDQLHTIAQAVRESGGHALRGGAFKPRTSPYSFQGLGRAALDLLAEARQATGLPVVTEVLDARHLEETAAMVDMVQIGARNMQNYALLREVGRLRVPVLLKRGLAATVDETLMAAEYILSGGNSNVVLCERGIRTFETSYRFTLDLSAVPVFHARTHLPVIVDPSHAAGDSRHVIPLALAAAAAGADGLIVESHCDPASALCDGRQALPTSRLGELMDGLRVAATLTSRQLAPAASGRLSLALAAPSAEKAPAP